MDDTYKTISEIADRYIKTGHAKKSQKLDLIMTLDFANQNYPMDLTRLLAASDSDFIHDLNGINLNMNDSGKLINSFIPRHAYVNNAVDRATVQQLLDDCKHLG